MFNNLANTLFMHRQVVVLDVFVLSSDSQTISCSLFEYKNGSVLLIENTQLDSINNFLFDKYSNVPVVVALNGKGVVQKQISANSDSSGGGQFQDISSDFYRVNSIFTNFTGIAFCRHETLNAIVGPLLDRKVKVVDCTIGVYCAIGLFEQHGIEKSYIGHGYSLALGKVQDGIAPTNEKVNLFGVDIASELFFPHLLAILFFLKGKIDADSVLPSRIQASRKSFLTVKRNKPIFYAFVGILFIGLLVTTFLRESVQERQSNLNYSLSQQRKEFAKEQAEKNKSDEILREARKLALYYNEYQIVLDRIGETMPPNLTLKSLKVNPVISKLTKNQEVVFKDGVVLIEGFSNRSDDISNWINVLNTQLWVSRVAIVSITNLEGKYQFEFEIFLKNAR
jgi:Tfp pilus assembly protein PilN